MQEKVRRRNEQRKLAELQRRFAANVAERLAWASPANVTHLVADGSCPFCPPPGVYACVGPVLLHMQSMEDA